MYSNKEYYLWIKSSVVLLSIIFLYWQDFSVLLNEAINSDLLTHLLAIPFLIAYLIYRARYNFEAASSELLAKPSTRLPKIMKDVIGIILCLFAYILRWVGSYSFIPLELHIASVPIFASGIVLLLFNFNTLRTLIFPIFFLFLLIPPPVELAEQAGAILSYLSSQAAYTVLKVFSFPVILYNPDGSPIIYLTLPSGEEYPFVIDVACSGIYSLTGFIIFGLFVAYLIRGAFYKKTVVILLGLPLIYALNIVRIIILIIIGYFSGPYAALNAFHIFGGWVLILLGTFFLLILAEKLLKVRLFDSTSIQCDDCRSDPNISYCISCGKINKFHFELSRLDFLKIFGILAISTSLILIQVPVYNLTNGSAEIFIKKYSGETFTTNIFPRINGYDLKFVYRDTSFEKRSGQDAALMYQYVPLNPSKSIIWVGLEIGPAKANLHAWEVCLVTWPQSQGKDPRVIQLDLRDVKLIENPPLTARYFAFIDRKNNFTETILYWYTKSVFKSEGEYIEKWSKISVIKLDNNPSDHLKAEEEIYPFAKAIAEYWQPVVTWSRFALAIAYHGTNLLLFLGVILAALAGSYLYLSFSRKRSAEKTFNKITNREDRTLLKIIKENKMRIITEKEISLRYVEHTGTKINEDIILKKLLEAENNDLIRRKIININDRPYITWKTNF